MKENCGDEYPNTNVKEEPTLSFRFFFTLIVSCVYENWGLWIVKNKALRTEGLSDGRTHGRTKVLLKVFSD